MKVSGVKVPDSRAIQKAVLSTSQNKSQARTRLSGQRQTVKPVSVIKQEELQRTNQLVRTIKGTSIADDSTFSTLSGSGSGNSSSSFAASSARRSTSSTTQKSASSTLVSSSSSSTTTTTSVSAAGDPLVILRCDSGHARQVTHLHLGRRGLSALHPHIRLFINLEELWLNDNNLSAVKGIAPPPDKHHQTIPTGCLRLKRLFLSNNQLTTLVGSDLSRLPHLETLLLANNRLSNLELVSQQLSVLVCLKQLEMMGNPLSEEKSYREYIIAHHPTLEVLDRHTISAAEREKALISFPPKIVSKSRGQAPVAFGTNVKTQRKGDYSSCYDDIDVDDDYEEDAMSAVTSLTNAMKKKNKQQQQQKNRNANNNNNNKAFMSQMAQVLEVRARNVKYKRSMQEERQKMREEEEFNEMEDRHLEFHRRWEKLAGKPHVGVPLFPPPPPPPQQDEKEGKGGSSLRGQSSAASFEKHNSAASLASVGAASSSSSSPAVVVSVSDKLPSLQKGVVSHLFQVNKNNNSRKRVKNRDFDDDDDDDDILNLKMERDPEIFAKVLDEAESETKTEKELQQLEIAALEPAELKAIKSAFPPSTSASSSSLITTSYPVREVCTRVADICSLPADSFCSSVTMASNSQPLVKHFLEDAKRVKHGRIEGEEIVRCLLHFKPFIEFRMEQLYQKANGTVRAKPSESLSILRRISTLSDSIKEKPDRKEAVGACFSKK